MRKVVAYGVAAILALSFIFLPGPLGRGVEAQQAAPELKRIGPSEIAAGGPGFTIRIEGKNFASNAQVEIDGQLLPSRVTQKSKVLLAEVPASLVASPGSHSVRAVNPGAGASATQTLTVVVGDPDLKFSLDVNTVQEDLGLSFTVEARGEGFDEDTRVLVWGLTRTDVNVISDTRLTFTLPEKYTRDAASIPIMVRNNGRLSNTDLFFIVPAPAVLSSIEPDSIDVGTEDFEIKLSGENFKPGAQILIRRPDGNITPLATTREKEGRLFATVPGSFRSSPAQLIVRVEQEGTQSADQILAVTPSDDPFIFVVAPSKVRLGEQKETVILLGANFGDRAEVLIDGEEVNVRDSSRTGLLVVVRGETLNQTGSHTIQVRGRDGAVSNVGTFEVVPDVSVSTVAGDDRLGFDPSCVSLSEARFRRPRRLALGPDGLLYVTDQQNHGIRTINFAASQVCTVAGTGVSGYVDSGDSSELQPSFSYPNGVAVAGDGTIYVSENGNNVIRRVRRTGSQVTVGTLAGTTRSITDSGRQKRLNSTKFGLDGFRDGQASTAAFHLPDDIVVAPDGSIYVADALNHSIRRITFSGGLPQVETVAGNGIPGFADGEALLARFNTPTALALSLDGTRLFIADTNNNRVRVLELQSMRVETYAGSGRNNGIDGPSGIASFRSPVGLAVDSDGTIYVSELSDLIRRIDLQRNVTVLAGTDAKKFRDGPGIDATFEGPRGLAIDRARGILYVADYENSRVRSIDLR